MTLSCKEGEWEFQNFTWELPAIDTEGYIMETVNSYVLTVDFPLPNGPYPVFLAPVKLKSFESQNWIIRPYKEGFYTIVKLIRQGEFELLLTMKNTTTTTIEGKSIIELLLLPFKRKKKHFAVYSPNFRELLESLNTSFTKKMVLAMF